MSALYIPVSGQSGMQTSLGKGCDFGQGSLLQQLVWGRGGRFSPEGGMRGTSVSTPFGFLVFVLNIQSSLVQSECN